MYHRPGYHRSWFTVETRNVVDFEIWQRIVMEHTLKVPAESKRKRDQVIQLTQLLRQEAIYLECEKKKKAAEK